MAARYIDESRGVAIKHVHSHFTGVDCAHAYGDGHTTGLVGVTYDHLALILCYTGWNML